ncbi:MAG TPA: zinc ABC transporter substrate-binding protein [Solirubrobacterales bacterium]|nr:zinc ABC transporter substrate-binding protein [Solirubrobacterales bacterium]
MSRLRVRSAVAAIAAIAAAGLAGCGAAGDVAGGGGGGEAVLEVAATTNIVADTAREVGGERVSVTGLMGPGVDPHLYKASAGDVETLRDADVIFYNGHFLEGKMAEVLGEMAERVPSVAVAEAIPVGRLLPPPAGAPDEEEFDPHVWFDPSLWRYAVEAIRDQLIESDPAGEATYAANTERLLADMRELEDYGREQIAAVPERRRVLVTSHDAFRYLGRAFGLDVVGIQGISTVDEATTADVDRVADLIADRGVRSVFIESSVPQQTIDAVVAAARERGAEVEVGGELFSDAAGEEGTPEGTYVGMVRFNLETIAAEL